MDCLQLMADFESTKYEIILAHKFKYLLDICWQGHVSLPWAVCMSGFAGLYLHWHHYTFTLQPSANYKK
jgi:hypothetical protein